MRALVLFVMMCGVALAQPSEARRMKLAEAWYRDVLGRPGSPPEHANWAKLMLDHPVITVAHEFLRLPEPQGLAYRELAVRAYGAVSDAEVLAFARVGQARRHVRSEARMKLVSKALARDSAAARVTAAHLLVLGRPPTKVELEAWGLAIAKGFLPFAICHQLEKSDEGLAVRATAIWRKLLGRTPALKELGDLFLNMRKGAVEEDVIAQVLASVEYSVKNGIPAE